MAGHRMPERARTHSLREGSFSTRPDFVPSCHVVSGFFTADDEVDRGNEDNADQDVHGKRHEMVPPSRAIYINSIARRRVAIKTYVNDGIPGCKIVLISSSISFNNNKVNDQSDDASRRSQ
jgi:hypothetical protein